MTLKPRWISLKGALVAAAMAAMCPAHAETGVTDTSISVGQTAVFSGPVAATGSNYRRGIELYFEQINKAGGVNGRKLQLTALDDAYDPKKTVENTRTLIEDNKVFALIGYVATANLIAAMPLAEEAKVPMFAPLVGTTSIRLKHNRYLFHVRASYQAELARITQQLAVIGTDKVAVVYQDSVFGKSNLETLLELAKAEKLQVLKTIPMAINAANASDVAAQLKQVTPNAIIMIMAGTMSEVLIRDVRGSGLGTPMSLPLWAACSPERRPNTSVSSSELAPRRLPPCTETHATSPAAYRPGMPVWPSTSVFTPPIV